MVDRLVEDLLEERRESARLRALLEQKAGCILGDLSAKLAAATKKLLADMKGGPSAV